ncbi:hypothetical protein KKE48_00855 [Patescibacteria group bacterium]|nr:hypothetical protein [Patescibacteria group bacterium]MBU1499403.1 hypothetical protein [Patescibacteria group bacterium]
MNFKLGKVVAYVGRSGADIQKAAREFFGKNKIYPNMPAFENIASLFNEWLIFDFKLPSGSTVISEYYLKNPDSLPDRLMDELKQIITTSVYDLFEVESLNKGTDLTVWGLFTGQRYRVLEKSLSLSLGNRKGCFFNRIAKVNGNYYFIGSNPVFLPVVHTDRSRKMFKADNREIVTPKNALFLLVPPKSAPPKPIVTEGGIKKIQQKLQKQFEELKAKYRVNATFAKLKNFLLNENYKDHFADFYKDIIAIGITEEMVVENIKFFQDFWNYFPHKKLRGKCPAERYREVYG